MRGNFKNLCIKTWTVMVALMMLLLITGCSSEAEIFESISYDRCTVVVEDSEECTVYGKIVDVKRGSDVTFRILLKDNRKILATDYPDYTIADAEVSSVDGANYQLLTLHNVRYSTVVSLTTYHPCQIRYHANGGSRLDGGDAGEPIVLSGSQSHLRPNTEQGTNLFSRDGFTLIGWNTEPDGSGTAIGLGSRVDFAAEIDLYAQWSRWTELSAFLWKEKQNGISITGYVGDEEILAIPGYIDGLPVIQIAEQAFRGANCRVVILPETMRRVAPTAFENAAVEELYFFDTLKQISDSSFSCCELMTIHINAARAPVYSGTYFDTFPDKMDWLMNMAQEQKIVLFSGSSARFGYDSPRIDEVFPSYTVANMGVYAYSNALPQYLLILQYMNEGDILLSAPEFDAIEEQFCVTNQVGHEFFAMVESNYDMFAQLDCRVFSGVLDDFQEFQSVREGMPKQSYNISAKNYDENREKVTEFETYNDYGDYIYPRPGPDVDMLFGIKLADYETASYPEEVVEHLNDVYRQFQNKGIKVWFSYAPRSFKAVTEGSTVEERGCLDAHLRELLCVPVISEIEESMFTGHYFYETDNHLSDEGVQIRTDRIIEDICAQMEQEGMVP